MGTNYNDSSVTTVHDLVMTCATKH